MKDKITYKNGFIVGSIAILIGIIIGITIQSDTGFIFAGLGTVIIGFSFLSYFNRKVKKEDDK